jgi:hypothetical protein
MVQIFKVHTNDNVADSMTKPVGRQIHERHLPYLMGQKQKILDDEGKGVEDK